MKNKLLIAHRGASAYDPENTLASFEKAIKLGANALEFDVRRTKDGVFVVHHNPVLSGKLIKEQSYDDLKNHSLSKNLEISRLEEVVESFRKRATLDAHLKEKNSAVEAAGILRDMTGGKRLIITSEYMDVLEDIRKKYSDLKLGYIVLKKNVPKFIKNFVNLRKFPENLLNNLHRKKIDFVVPYHLFVGKNLLSAAKTNGIGVLPWTLNSSRGIRKFLKSENVVGVLSDKPDLFKYET